MGKIFLLVTKSIFSLPTEEPYAGQQGVNVVQQKPLVSLQSVSPPAATQLRYMAALR